MRALFLIGVFLLEQAVLAIYFGVTNFCVAILILVGLTLTISGLSGCKSSRIRLAGFGLIEIGILFSISVILCFYTVHIVSYGSAEYRKELDISHFAVTTFDVGLLTFLAVFFLGTGLFLLNPPDLTARRTKMKFGNGSNTWKKANPTGKGKGLNYTDETEYGDSQSMDNLSADWNVIDQALWDIMNADTTLRSVMNTDQNLASKIQATFNFYNPQSGVFTSWATRLRGEGRTKLLEVLNKEQQLLIQQAALFESQVRNGVREQVEFKMFLAQNAMELLSLKTTAELHKKAFEKEMVPEDWSKVRVAQETSKIRMEEEQILADLQQKSEQEALNRKLKEETERAERLRIEEEERIKRNLESAIAYKRNEDTITNNLRKELEDTIIELEILENRTDLGVLTKAKLLAVKNNKIENLEHRIKAREEKAKSDEESYL